MNSITSRLRGLVSRNYAKGGGIRHTLDSLRGLSDRDLSQEIRKVDAGTGLPSSVMGDMDRRGSVRRETPDRRRFQDLMDEQVRRRRASNVPGPLSNTDRLSDLASRFMEKKAEGGKVSAVQGLTRMMQKYMGDAPQGARAAGPDPKQAKIQSLVQQFQAVSQQFEQPNLDPMTERRLDQAAGQILQQLGQLGFDTTQLTGG